MAETPSILFAGFGYVAEATAARLAASGWRVLASTRSADTAAKLDRLGYGAVHADPSKPEGAEALREAARKVTAIIFSAAPGEAGDPFLPAFADMDLSQTWLGYLSTTGVYGDRKGGWAFEDEPVTPGQPRSVRRAKVEAAWTERGARLFRLSGIYGPGRSPLDRVRSGDARVFDKPGQVFSRVHVDDIASVLIRALEQPDATGAFNLADDHPSSQVEVTCGAAEMLGVPAPEITPFDPDQASAMQASFFSECRRVSNARAKAVLGWRPAYPSWREGLAAILQQGG